MKQDKILVIGAGAIGSFYGAILSKAGAEVSVVCRSDYPVVKQRGFKINSSDLGSWIFTPSQVVRSAAEYQGQADYLILCTKITADSDRVQLIKDAVSNQTCIVFIQNGVEIEQELVDAFPDNEIISGLAFICCNRINPGETLHLAYGKLTLGSLNRQGSSDKTKHLADLINKTGIEAQVSEQIVMSRWLKCLWNAPFNPVSVLSGGLSTQEILSAQEPLIRTIMHEVLDIAKACGYPLPMTSIETNLEQTYVMPPYKTSMLLDYQQGKAMETEVIIGNTVRAAKRQRVNCPTLDTLYALLKLKELEKKSK